MLPQIWPVTCHTDYVGPNSTFVAIKGQQSDGLAYLPTALARGATKIVVAQESILTPEILAQLAAKAVELIRVANPRQALSNLSAAAWGYPAQKLKIIAVTGTKGKTTSAYCLKQLLSSLGHRTALLSGVQNIIDQQALPADLTTPQPDFLQMFLAQCVQAQIEYVVMEAAAQGFSLHRLDDVQFTAAIFTNLEQEHAEFYANLDDYFAAKCQLLNRLLPGAPVIFNYDNDWSRQALALAQAQGLNARSFSLQAESALLVDYVIKLQQAGTNGLELEFLANDCVQPGDRAQDKLCPRVTDSAALVLRAPNLWGQFNAYNLAGVLACLAELGFDLTQLVVPVTSLIAAPGRLERYQLANGASAVIDYAHTPSSFKALLSLLRTLTPDLIVVFGASGDRDPFKRPLMGQIAAQLADCVIITTDNPRTEDATKIWQAVYAGVLPADQAKVRIEPDRALAIALAASLCQPQSIMAVLGKGPDEYQIFGREKTFFSDRQEVLKACY
ncbi:MAG TPA: UDP-N-acetylmuramoyl-L-alanyl-D-glutamate--2,6-diaminopimelate ligase [Candidatus Babeliales bacterium]|nr:UDP-N-acetylmuramoyl-L-alanyl-D-glutamate--2,6-diaminopimelate ligase [Candidatus Babeliales bacterium]